MRYPKGNPNNPMSPEDVEDKFRGLAARTLPDPQINRLTDLFSRLETLASVNELLDATRV